MSSLALAALTLNFLPEAWQEPAKYVLVGLIGGLGALVAARLLVSLPRALFVATVAGALSGGAAYVVFAPEPRPPKDFGEALRKIIPPIPSEGHAQWLRPQKKSIRIEWNDAKKQLMVDGQPAPVLELGARIKRLKQEHPELTDVVLVLNLHLGQIHDQIKKLCAELNLKLSEEGGPKKK